MDNKTELGFGLMLLSIILLGLMFMFMFIVKSDGQSLESIMGGVAVTRMIVIILFLAGGVFVVIGDIFGNNNKEK